MPPTASHALALAFTSLWFVRKIQPGLPHVLLAAARLSPQHCSAPPGRVSHPTPPHTPHDAAQHFSPDGSEMPPLALHLAENTVVSRAWASTCVSIKHGGSPQGTFAACRLSTQQADAPPSRSSQPGPPQVPQVLEQQNNPDSSGTPPAPRHLNERALAALASTPIVHGGCPHCGPDAFSASPQQASAPPGRDSHPEPPHTPHELEQHVSPSTSGVPPISRHACATFDTPRFCCTAGLSIKHGGDPHGTLAESMSSPQQAAAPPSRDMQFSPPQVPQEAEQHRRPVKSGIPPADAHADMRAKTTD